MRKLAIAAAAATVLLTVAGFGTSQPAYAEEHELRFYDREHRDHHRWDAHEDRAYRSYLEGRHKSYVEFRRLRREHQRRYWHWRHEHPDSD